MNKQIKSIEELIKKLGKVDLNKIYDLICNSFNIGDTFYKEEIFGAKWVKTSYGYDWGLFGYSPSVLDYDTNYFCEILCQYCVISRGDGENRSLFTFIKRVPKLEIERLSSFIISYKFRSGTLKIIHKRENPEDITILDKDIKKLKEEVKVINIYLKNMRLKK